MVPSVSSCANKFRVNQVMMGLRGTTGSGIDEVDILARTLDGKRWKTRALAGIDSLDPWTITNTFRKYP